MTFHPPAGPTPPRHPDLSHSPGAANVLPSVVCNDPAHCPPPTVESGAYPFAGQPPTPPAPDDPPYIYRADLIAALDSIAITDPGNLARLVITPEFVEVTRFATSPTGGKMVDLQTDRPATTTTRIQVI